MILECKNALCHRLTTPAARYQTERYGRGMRVHNPARAKKEDERIAGCTVCGTLRMFTEGDAKAAKGVSR